jgi:hypothetical protein
MLSISFLSIIPSFPCIHLQFAQELIFLTSLISYSNLFGSASMGNVS